MKSNKLLELQTEYLFLESQYRNLAMFIQTKTSELASVKAQKLKPIQLTSAQTPAQRIEAEILEARTDLNRIIQFMDKVGREILSDYEGQHAFKWKYLTK